MSLDQVEEDMVRFDESVVPGLSQQALSPEHRGPTSLEDGG